MSIKVLRIIARLNIGGPARNAVLLSDNNKWDTLLVCGEVEGDEGDMTYLAREKGINPVIVKELGRKLSFKNDWKAFWKIYRIIKKERPDVIHTHTAKAGTLGRLAGILYNITHVSVKLIHTFHGHVFHSYFSKVKTCFFIWIEKILAVFTDRIITVSESLKKELTVKFRIAPERKISVVELGFELDDLLNMPVKEESGIVKVGIIGRLTSVKNHRMLLRIVKEMGQSQKSGTVPGFIIIGDGELRQELEKYAEELGIKDIVEFRGWVKDVVDIYRDIDIVALTSLNEGTPVSVIEAMAAARPVVATNVGGVRDVVRDGENGYLVDSGNEDVFSEKLMDLIKDPEKRKIFGKSGRDSVRERFSKETLINNTDKLYNKLLNRSLFSQG